MNNLSLGNTGFVIDEVYDYYDGPRAFSCYDCDNHYFGLWCEEKSHQDRWLLVPICDDDQLEAILSGNIPIRELIETTDQVFLLTTSNGQEISRQAFHGHRVPDAYMPDKNTKLNIKF